jgi:hypothetical protein
MRSFTRVAVTAAATLLSAAGLAVSTTGAASAHCPTEVYYSVKATNTYIPFKGLPTFKDGKGGTLTVGRDFTKSASYQVTAGAESEVGAVFAKAKVSVSASITKTNSSTVTHNYSHKISAGKYGHVQYVAWSKNVTWKKYQDTPQCTTELLRSGTIKFPTNSEGWRYWETKS